MAVDKSFTRSLTHLYRRVGVSVLPVMKHAVRIVMVTVSAVTISWPPYQPPTNGAGTRLPAVEVASYDVETTVKDPNWTAVASVAANVPDATRYRHRVGGLIPGTRYRFRVVIVWLNDKKPTRSIPGPASKWVRTHCGWFRWRSVFYVATDKLMDSNNNSNDIYSAVIVTTRSLREFTRFI